MAYLDFLRCVLHKSRTQIHIFKTVVQIKLHDFSSKMEPFLISNKIPYSEKCFI